MRRPGLVVGTAAAAALLLVACGGGGGDDSNAAGAGDGRSAEGGGGSGGDIPGVGDDGGGGGGEFCGGLGDVMGAGSNPGELLGGDPSSLQEAFAEAAEDWPERAAAAEAAAPGEIADDLGTVLEATGQMFEALANADRSDPEAMATALAGLQYGPEVQAASARLQQWSAEHCGLGAG